MTIKDTPWWAWLIPISLLLITTAQPPSEYYTFLRMAVSVSCTLFVVVSLIDHRLVVKLSSIPLFAVAGVFNFFIPVRLNWEGWLYLSIVSAAIFAAHLVFVRLWPWLK